MKRLLSIFVVICFSGALMAQISVEKDTVHHYFKNSGQSESKVIISTTSITPLKISYEIIYDNVKTTWKDSASDPAVQFCDCNNCNVDYPSIDTCDFDLSDTDPYLYSLYVDPKGNKDIRYLTVVIRNMNDANDTAVITFVTDTSEVFSTPEHLINGSSDIKISPNPTSGSTVVTLTGFKAGEVELNVVDLLGHVVMRNTQQVEVDQSEFDLNLEELNRGIYFIRVGDGVQSLTKKVIVR